MYLWKMCSSSAQKSSDISVQPGDRIGSHQSVTIGQSALVTQIFISDLHLSEDRPELTKLFERFLQGPARQADRLFILGDLFDSWAGDDDIDAPFNRQVISDLSSCSASGTRIFFTHGNRDFLAGDQLAKSCRMQLLEEISIAELDDGNALLCHGDTLCTDDVDYQRFRREIRSTEWIGNFLSRPLIERKRIIENLRKRSESEKRDKPPTIMDVNSGSVEDLFRRHDMSRLIHGHTHRPGRHDHIVENRRCVRWVLGDWNEHGNYLQCDNQGMVMHVWRGN
mgnify:CR=1 FL=1